MYPRDSLKETRETFFFLCKSVTLHFWYFCHSEFKISSDIQINILLAFKSRILLWDSLQQTRETISVISRSTWLWLAVVKLKTVKDVPVYNLFEPKTNHRFEITSCFFFPCYVQYPIDYSHRHMNFSHHHFHFHHIHQQLLTCFTQRTR